MDNSLDKLINKELETIKRDIPKIAHLQDEYIFSLMCFKYFYNDGYLDIKDFKSCFVDGKNDGGIDLITVNEVDFTQTNLVFIQSKHISEISNKQDIIDIFTKIDQTIRNFQDNRISTYNQKLRRIFKDKIDYVEDKNAIFELTLFVNVDIDEDRKSQIKDSLDKIDSLDSYLINIYYKNDIINQINSVNEPIQYVPEAKIKYNNQDGMLKYGENGVLINISALSIRDIYYRYKDKGLFEKNFRYYIKHKKIDDNINNSLKNKRKDFWYLNNGIIIGCSDFVPDGNEIKVYDFSIINGCQTTTLIGEYHGKNENEDFYIPCKIIKSAAREDQDDFITNIAEASNSQKPISERDLKANTYEQRALKKQLENAVPSIHLIIKKGEQKVSKKGKEEWQIISNDVLGQLILAFNLQQPGTARRKKKNIFADDNTYKRVFKRKHDITNIIELLKLDYYYNIYADKVLKEDTFNTPDEESIVIYGRFFILAVIGFMLKMKRRTINTKLISNDEEWEKEITVDNIDGKIFADYSGNDFEDLLNALFSTIVYEIFNIYSIRSKEEKSVANFLKTDYKYRNYIIKNILSRLYQNKIELNRLEAYLKCLS